MALTVRPLAETDWPQVHALVVEVARDGRTYAMDVPADVAATRAFWSGDLLVVAVDGDTVLGAAKAGPNRPAAGSHVGTASFMVGEAARGHGVGRALGRHVVEWHRSAGFRAIQFNAVVSTNTSAVRLWRSLGFEVVGTVPAAFALPGEEGAVGSYADLLVMHLDLTRPAVADQVCDAGDGAPDRAERDHRIAEAAVQSFERRGWSGTTPEGVAAMAGLPAAEVSRLFGTKGDLLITAMRLRLAGRHPDLREAFAALRLEEVDDVDERLAGVITFVRDAVVRVAPLVRALWQAADEDPVAEALRRGAELRRLALSRSIAELLVRGEQMAPDAVGAVQTLTTAENYLCLTGVGWSDERYAGWLADALDHAVNGQAGPAARWSPAPDVGVGDGDPAGR